MIDDFFKKPNPAERIPQEEQMATLRAALAAVERPVVAPQPKSFLKLLTKRIW